MTKDEARSAVMGAISMALKDPTLQQGFEIICKNLAELEKENAELRNNGFTVSAMTEQQLKVALEKGEQLEKENAELKGLVSQYKVSKCSGISMANRNMIMSDQLTKAKELLKEFVHHYKDKTIYIENMQDLLEQAEQFLSEVEK